MIFKDRLIKLTLAGLITVGAANSYGSSASWRIDVAPYLWATSMHGTVQLGEHTIHVSQSFSDILKHFQGGAMLYLNAHKDKWGVFFNAMYSVLEQREIIRDIHFGVHNNFGIFSAGATYEIFQHNFAKPYNQILIELLAGARYTLNDTKLTIDRFNITNKENWTDPIIGMRLNYDFTNTWQTTLEGDIGGANRHHSYNLQGYLGYKPIKPLIFNNVILYLGYRFLHQYYQTGINDNLYVWDMDIKGPVIGFKTIF